jgi:membrane protease YdiL (CAAX protease family)
MAEITGKAPIEPTRKPQPDPVPWTARDVWLGVASLVLWWLLFGFFSVLAVLVGVAVNPGVYIGLAELLLLVPVWWFSIRKYGVGWDALGLREFKGTYVGLGCGLMVLTFVFNAVYSTILALFDIEVQPDLVPIFAELSSPWWLLIAGVIVAPIVEEIFFRGFIFAGLRSRYEWRWAAVISSLLFALVHLQPAALIPIFGLGYIFAYLYYRSNSIWPAILMHVTTNGMALGAAYLTSTLELST